MPHIEQIGDDPVHGNDKKKLVSNICLNMIVKNESHCIRETLECMARYVDYYIISDTGSTDDTKEIIKKFFDSRGIKGEIYDDPWKNFGYNRSKALEYCAGRCKYAFVMDADDLIHGNLAFPAKMEADGYHLQFGKEFVYWRCQLFRMDRLTPESKPAWKYVRVLHEYGARNKETEKYKRDAEVLEKAIVEEGEIDRYRFYLAQSYMDDKQYEKAITNYARRVEMGGWIEEVYYSQYRLALCEAMLNKEISVVINSFSKATKLHPGRIEAFYEMTRIMRLNKLFRPAYELGSLGLGLPYNDNYLFCMKVVHDYMLADEIAICAYQVGEYGQSLRLCEQILRGPHLPESQRKRVEINRRFAEIKVREVGEREKPLLCFYTGYATVYTADWNNVYGGEISLRTLAQHLSKKYRVVVFSENCPIEGMVGDVLSLPGKVFDRFQEVNQIDVLVVSRYLCYFLEHEVRAKKVIWWYHDVLAQPYWNGTPLQNAGLALMRNMDNKIDTHVALTNWHKDVINQHYKMPVSKIKVIGHGVQLIPWEANKRIPQRLIYTSFPTRGLTHLLRLVKVLHAEFPKLELIIYRGEDTFDAEQNEQIKEMPYVQKKGCIHHQELLTEFQKADLWLYPTNFNETFCMSALEAQMAGCLCITSAIGALNETVADRGVLIHEPYGTPDYDEAILKAAREALSGRLEGLRHKAREWAATRTWESVADSWDSIIAK